MPKRSMNPIDAHVGARVRLRRMLIGMSQERLGELLGVTFQQVQKYEKGTNRIGASRLYEMSRILEVAVQFFFDEMPEDGGRPASRPAGFSEGEAEPYNAEIWQSQDVIDLAKAYSGIKAPRSRRAVLEVARSLAAVEGG